MNQDNTAGSSTSRGLLIAFDGVDSSGKETQAKKLVDRLRYAGFTVHRFQTPDYDTPSGQELKRRLQNKDGSWEATSWQEKNGYFAANRAEHRDEVLAALERGEMVVYDRYIPSSLAFMTVEAHAELGEQVTRQEVYDHIMKTEIEENSMPREDVSIFLDVPPRVSAVLLEQRKEKLADEDEYTDHISVQERLYEEYDHLCKEEEERFIRVPCIQDVEMRPVEVISDMVWRELQERFPVLRKAS